MTAIIGSIITAILNWFAGIVGSAMASKKQSDADHAADQDQANQDTGKLEQVNPDTSGSDTSEAIDNSLKHL